MCVVHPNCLQAQDDKGALKKDGLGHQMRMAKMAQRLQVQELINYLEARRKKNYVLTSWDLQFLCWCYMSLRVYNKAEENINMLEMSIRQGDSRKLGSDISSEPLAMRASIALDMGNYAKTVTLSDKAQAILDSVGSHNNSSYQSQLIGLATVRGIAYAFLHKKEMALGDVNLISKVPEELSDILGPAKYSGIARIYMACGDYANALKAINNPSSKVSSMLSMFYNTTFQEIPNLFIRSKSNYETGNIQLASDGYLSLIKHPYIEQLGEIYWIILSDLAEIEKANGRDSASLEYLEKAIHVIEKQRASIYSEAGKIGFVGDKENVYQQIIATYYDQGDDKKAFHFIERAKARALVDLLAEQSHFSVAGRSANDGLLDSLAVVESMNLNDETNDIAKARERQKTRAVQIRQQIQSESPELSSLIAVNVPKPMEIQRKLKPDEALLEYYYDERFLYVFLVSREDIIAKRLEKADLLKEIMMLRISLRDANSEDYRVQAKHLFKLMIAPVMGSIRHPKLIIIPHGIIHYLPFACLMDGDTFLIERWNFRILPSASILLYLKDETNSPLRNSMLLGNPDLHDPRLDLAYAQDEAESISRLFENNTLLLRDNASETNFRNQVAKFDHIHFANHGFFDQQSPLQSALLLSPDKVNDGYLTVGELYSMRLNVKLVAMSACETALGKVMTGDDVVGFTRGWLYAGAQSILSSLWKVDDKATRDLMIAFYQNIRVYNYQEALQKAQLEIRRHFPHPYYWSAFQLTGSD